MSASEIHPPPRRAEAGGDAPPTAAPTNPRLRYCPWLHAYCMLFVLATFALVVVGGIVTSLDVGLAVPGGWWTFDYFTLWAPLYVWWDEMGTRWEHGHRLMGYLVGFMSIGLAVWLFVTQKARPWLRWAGPTLLVLVIIQGVMGAARVDRISTDLAVFHGIFGQIFFALTVFVTAATSRVWIRLTNRRREAECNSQSAGNTQRLPRGLRWLTLVLLAALLVQLALGAWMRHHGQGGPAVPDFPTAYGQVLPPTEQAVLDATYQNWPGTAARPASVAEVWVHMGHRFWAVAILAIAAAVWTWIALVSPRQPELRWPNRWVMILLMVQIGLGAYVIWTAGHPNLTSAHQFTGAALLGCTVWLAARVHLASPQLADRLDAPQPAPPLGAAASEVRP